MDINNLNKLKSGLVTGELLSHKSCDPIQIEFRFSDW